MMYPKPTKIVSKKLRDSARGESCSLRIPGICNGNRETTVLAHLNSNRKGTGNKSPDIFAVYACSSCHDWLDGRVIQGLGHRSAGGYSAKLRALMETQIKLHEKGLIKIKGVS